MMSPVLVSLCSTLHPLPGPEKTAVLQRVKHLLEQLGQAGKATIPPGKPPTTSHPLLCKPASLK